MKVTICGSIAFYDEMCRAKEELELHGHEVKLPPSQVPDESGKMIPVKDYYSLRKAGSVDDGWLWDMKEKAMMNHFQKVEWSDAVLVLNVDKKGIAGYVGANTLLEMGLAFFLSKKIFMLNQIPDISYREEILGMKPLVIEGDFSSLK